MRATTGQGSYFVSSKNSLSVTPLSCEFHDVELGVTYEMVVTLKNAFSKAPKRVRVGAPMVDLDVGPVSPFSLIRDDFGEGVVSMHYGLEKKIRVRYTCPPGQRSDCHTSFSVKVENEPPIIVALHAYPPKAYLEHDTTLDLGVVVVNHATAKPFLIRNTGAKPAKFKIEIDSPLQLSLSISPMEGVVSPKSELKVIVRFEAKEGENQLGPGIFNDAIFIFQEDVGSIKGVDLLANIVEQSVQLLVSESDDPTDEEALRRISSGDALIVEGLYFGQSRTIFGALVNSGPQSSSFSVSVGLADDASELEEKDERSERQLGLVVLNASPTEGTLDPFSHQKLQVEFTPHLLDSGGFQPGFSRDYNRKITVGIVETGQTVDLVLVAKAWTPWVSLDKSELVFPECFVGNKLSAQFSITNHSPEMGVDFIIPRVAHFKCVPAKGWLPPQESITLDVVFNPQQLGNFRTNLELKLADNFTMLLRLHANAKHATSSGTSTSRPSSKLGEEDRQPSLPKLQYNASTSPSPGPSSPESMEILAKKKQNYGKYVSFLRSAQASRASKSRRADSAEFEFGVNMGMEPGVGLSSPRLVLPKIDRNSPLPVLNGSRKALGSKLADQGNTLNAVSLKNQFMKRRFKPQPTTQNEIRECKARLSRGDLLQSVTAGNKKIDFGIVAVGSENTRLFDFSNGLRHHIHVQLTSDHPELSGVEPTSQVVPPGATTSFDIPFSSAIPQHFFSTLTYTINYAHTYTITVTAQVVPITLELTRDDIHLVFQPNHGRPWATETIGLRNPHKQKAEFKAISITPLHSEGSCFTITPSEGIIEPLSTLDLEVRFYPQLKGGGYHSITAATPSTATSKAEKEKEKDKERPPRLKWEETIAFKVNNGPDKLLLVSGAVTPTMCSFVPRKIDMGVLAVGLIAKRSVKITNSGQNDAYFEFDSLTIPDIVVSPGSGYVPAGGSQDIIITLQPQTQQVYNSLVLTAFIPGSKPIKLTIEARADFPTVIVQQEQFDFGGVYIGAAAKLPFTLNNLGTIPAMLVLDLSPYTNFAVQIPPEMEKSGDAVLVKAVKAEGGALAHSASGMDSSAAAVAASSDTGKTVWQLNMAPGSSWNFFLTFRPTRVEQLSFELPLGISGKPNKSSLQRTVTAMGLKPLLHIAPLIADFGPQVVQKEGSKSNPVHETLMLVNECDKPLQWELDTSHPLVVQGVFIVQPVKGNLEVGQRAAVRASFCPQERVAYIATIPVHLVDTGGSNNSSANKPYLELVLKGEGIFPMLTFYPHEVVLPIVPLGVKGATYFWVLNNGYDQLELNYRLPVDKEQIPLLIEFPTGNNTLGPHREKVLVQVHFTATKPISFTAKIEFFDGEGNTFCLPVSGTSENCMLTVFPYLTPRSGNYGNGFEKYEYNSRASEIMLVSKTHSLGTGGYAKNMDRDRVPFAPAIPSETFALIHAALPLPWDQLNSPSTGNSTPVLPISALNKGGSHQWPTLPDHTPLYPTRGVAFMASWLSANMPLKAPIKDIPGDLIQSSGLIIWDMIEAVTGKKISGTGIHRPPVKTPTDDKWTNSHAVLQSYQSLFTFLQAHGAFLNVIRPEFLLDLEDFLRIKTPKLTAAQRSPIQGYIEKLYLSVCSDSWMFLLQQVIKIYALRPVTYKGMKAQPGMQHYNLGKERGSGLTGGMTSSGIGAAGAQSPSKIKRGPGAVPIRSNIYSDSELSLLLWVSYHSARGNPAHRPLDSAGHISNLDSELRDGIVLGAVMMSHISFPQPPRLSSMYQIPTEREHLIHNASNIVGALKEIGLDWAPTITDVVDGSPLDMLLLALYFYTTLPMLTPQAELRFSAKIHQRVVQSILLSNPSLKPVTYAIRLDGSTHFKVSADSITIDGKSEYSLPVEFITPFSVQSEARLMLQSKRVIHTTTSQANAQRGNPNESTLVVSPANILIFRLKSSVDPSQPHKQLNFTAKIYSLAELPIEIENPLKCTGKFKLTIGQERRPPLFEPFRCQHERMILKDSEKIIMPLFFLPLRVGQSTCRLQFYDEKAGEFSYLITVDVTHPSPIETIKLLCEENQSTEKDILLQVSNPLLSHIKEMVNRLVDPTGKKRLRNDALVEIADFSVPPGTPLVYSIEYSSPYFSGPDHVTVQTNPETLKPMQNTVGTGHPRFSVKFLPKNAGIYCCTITLVCDWDIRVYEIEARAYGKSTVLRLDFIVPARQSTIQEIPVYNPDPKEWVLQSSFADCKYFSGPASILIPAKQHLNFPLTFKPLWMCETEGTLTLVNGNTGDRFIYQLRGKASEPLAEEPALEIRCVARKRATTTIRIPASVLNHNFMAGGDELRIDSDIPYVRGAGLVKAKEGQDLEYELAILVPHAKRNSFSGVVKFTSPTTGQYVWYSVKIAVSRAPPEETIDVKCTIRDKVQISIPVLSGQIGSSVDFVVTIEGNGLHGSPIHVVDPDGTVVYELSYSPLAPAGNYSGSVRFFNEDVGEFWYSLNLTAVEPSPINLVFECELGKSQTQTITIDNPANETTTVEWESNSHSFRITPLLGSYDKPPLLVRTTSHDGGNDPVLPETNKLIMQPLSSTDVEISYWPSHVGTQTCDLDFTSDLIGNWNFKLKGIGRPPTTMDTTILIAAVESSVMNAKKSTAQLRIVNVLDRDAVAHFRIVSDEPLGIFEVSMQSAELPVHGVLSVPVSFSPPANTMWHEHHAAVVVKVVSDDVLATEWIYPLCGVIEMKLPAVQLSTMAKKITSLTVQLGDAPVKPGYGSAHDDLDIEWIYSGSAEDPIKAVEASLSVTTSESDISSGLCVGLQFLPLKSFSATMDLLVTQKSGLGRWRIPISLSASIGALDDIISIQSTGTKPGGVAFALRNPVVGRSPFVSTIAPSSNLTLSHLQSPLGTAFSILPSKGYLSSDEDTIFKVVFVPNAQVSANALLTIETPEIIWRYELRGITSNNS